MNRERRNGRRKERKQVHRSHVPFVSSCLFAFWPLCLLSLMTSGCHKPSAGYDKLRMAQTREKIHEIQPLKLDRSEPNQVAVEPNAPPATMDLSLEQCRMLALENNLSLKASLISPTIAAARLSQEEAKFQSAFYANLNAGKTDNPSISFSDQVTGSKSDYLRGATGVDVPLRTGGTVRFELSDGRTKTDAIGTQFNPYYGSDLSVSISQPLLQNAGRWVSTYSIRIVMYDRDIADARARLDVITLLAAIDRVYWRLYAARRNLELRQQQYELSQAQLDRARRLVEGGQRAEIEVIRAEAGMAQQLEAIIIAENNLRDRERELKRVVNKAGLDVQTSTILVPRTEPDPVRYELDRSRFVQVAMDSRMELLELQLQLLQGDNQVEFYRNQTLPVAVLGYTYNITGIGAAQSDSFDMLLDSDFTDHQVSLQMRVPIGNQIARQRLRQAIYTRRQLLATRANREGVIKTEVLNAVDQVEANWQRILAARQNTIVNARLYEAEKRQFEVGMSTSTDVLDAQFNFANAQSSEINALVEYQISLVDLAYATGTILGAARIQWEPIVPPADAG
ncbi:MAG TPA: TolC family protein [Sedimentisphaerales bacterium]|nr:TolC family protein [Sedimentisphaerales bacterium]